MQIKPFLELRKAEFNSPKEFYRYDVAGAKIWFEQHLDTGCIYSVSVRLPETLADFHIYVFCDDNTLFYPIDIKINMVSQDFYIDKALELTEQIMQVKFIAQVIESIFAVGSEHHKLFTEMHLSNANSEV